MEQSIKAADGVVVFEIREEGGRFVFTFTSEFYKRVTREEWYRMRRHISEQLGYPEWGVSVIS